MPDALHDALAGLQGGGALEAERLHAALQQRMFGGPPRPVRLGRFTIAERIGHGAMGEVYAAHDPDLDRRVALKLIRPVASQDEHEAEQAHRRLRREAQAMARLSHPNVVTIHEVGELRGRVYLVMELVEGRDLRRWLESDRLWSQIVDVFIAAGRGLAAAHAAGVIHRDFKPHNVLVGDDGRVRVADFGLAGLDTQPPQRHGTELSRDAQLTQTGAVMGTPAYMAPEQHQGEADARTDQYAFCVALFEALHGYRPDDSPPESNLRDAGPKRLRAILLRGLREDPQRRYPSMDALLVDLDRARGRRRTTAAAAVFGGLALVAWAGLRDDGDSPLQACLARASRWEQAWTDDRQKQLARRLRDDSPARAEEALEATARAIEAYGHTWRAELDAACRATHAEGVQPTAALSLRLSCLDRRIDSLESLLEVLGEPDGEPAVRAPLAVGGLQSPTTCTTAGLAAETEADAPEVRERIHRARALVAVGRSPEAVELVQADAVESTPVPGRLQAELHEVRALALRDVGRLGEAREQVVAGIAAAEASGATTARARGAIALADLVGYAQADPTAGLEWAQIAEAILDGDVRSPVDGTTLRMRLHHARGNARFTQGRYADALAEHRQALEHALTREPADEASVGAQRMTMANTLLALGQPDQAREQLELALAIHERALGPSHPRVGLAQVNLSNVALAQGRMPEATERARAGLRIFERSRPAGHADLALAHNALGTALASAGDLAGSVEPFEQAVTIWSGALGPQHPRVGNARGNLALAYFGLDRYPEALNNGRAALDIQLEVQGPDHPDVALVRATLGRTLLDLGRLTDAEAQLVEAHRVLEAALGPDHAQLGPILLDLGRVRMGLERLGDAIDTLKQAKAIFEATDATPVQRGGCEYRLGQAYWRRGETKPPSPTSGPRAATIARPRRPGGSSTPTPSIDGRRNTACRSMQDRHDLPRGELHRATSRLARGSRCTESGIRSRRNA